jgi:hypothetical protein
MSMEQCWLECFCEVVRHVDVCVDSVEYHEVAFHPVAQGKDFDINMACAGCGFLSIAHCGAAIIIFI